MTDVLGAFRAPPWLPVPDRGQVGFAGAIGPKMVAPLSKIGWFHAGDALLDHYPCAAT